MTKLVRCAIIISMENKKIIGATEYVYIGNNKNPIPARIDTGAKSTAVWATIIKKPKHKQDILKFKLFRRDASFYDDELYETTNFTKVLITSSNGTAETRYRVHLPIEIRGERFDTTVNLADRGSNTYPVLIGRRELIGRFLVDPSIDKINLGAK